MTGETFRQRIERFIRAQAREAHLSELCIRDILAGIDELLAKWATEPQGGAEEHLKDADVAELGGMAVHLYQMRCEAGRARLAS